MNVTRTTTWIDNQVLTAPALDGEFNNLLNAPNIVNADIASGAAIASSKLAFGGTNGQYLKSNGDGTLSYAGISRAFGFFIPDVPSVANDLSWDPTSPVALTAAKLWAYSRTAPVGSSLSIQIYNVTQAHIVGSVSITTGNNTANSVSFSNASIAAGDVLRCDVTAVGSTTAGGNISIILDCTS